MRMPPRHDSRGVGREFIAALTETYGASELEVQVQPIPMKRTVGVGAAIVGTRGERTWLRPDEITVTATPDAESGTLRVCIGAPECGAPLFLADVDVRRAAAIRVRLSDLHPDTGSRGSANQPQND